MNIQLFNILKFVCELMTDAFENNCLLVIE